MEIKSMDTNGINFLIGEEGLKLKPYPDSRGIPTIGVGCTYYEDGTRVKLTDPPITRERAISLYQNILKLYETTVWSVTRDDINQNQFNALVSICFNIGVQGFKGSTLLVRVNKNPKDPSITEAFLMWRNAGDGTHNHKDDDGDGLVDEAGEKLPVLLERRKREAKLYFS